MIMFEALFAGSPEKRVARGVKWLDANAPGWTLKVNPDTLDLGTSRDCVLGQVYGDYNACPPIQSRATGNVARFAVRHGFDTAYPPHEWGMTHLDRRALELEWCRVLRVRRGAEILAA